MKGYTRFNQLDSVNLVRHVSVMRETEVTYRLLNIIKIKFSNLIPLENMDVQHNTRMWDNNRKYFRLSVTNWPSLGPICVFEPLWKCLLNCRYLNLIPSKSRARCGRAQLDRWYFFSAKANFPHLNWLYILSGCQFFTFASVHRDFLGTIYLQFSYAFNETNFHRLNDKFHSVL